MTIINKMSLCTIVYEFLISGIQTPITDKCFKFDGYDSVDGRGGMNQLFSIRDKLKKE